MNVSSLESEDIAREPASPDLADPDVSLVVAAARGEREALGALYDLHAPTMLALGLRIFGSRREAEDLLHDVFVEVWKRAGDYDPRRGTVKTWLLLRMRSRCLDRVRSAGYSRGVSLDARPEVFERQRAESDEVESAPDRRRVRSALTALPPEQRAVVELGYFKGWSSSEIAAHLDVPVGTVKSRLRVALGRLRDALGVTP